jgi:hypothetical protein
MGRVRVVCFHIRSSKGGSHHLCHLRPMTVGPWGSSIDYVLAHTFFMGSCKVSRFDCHWVGRHPTTPIVMYTGIVYEPLMDSPECGIAWKMCTRVRWAWLDSLIVVMNCGRSWCLHEPRVSCCQVLSLQGVYWFKYPWHPQIWVRFDRCVQT